MSFPKAYLRTFLAFFKTRLGTTLIERVPEECAKDLESALQWASKKAEEKHWYLAKVAEE